MAVVQANDCMYVCDGQILDMAFAQARGCKCMAFVLADEMICEIAVVIRSHMAQQAAVI